MAKKVLSFEEYCDKVKACFLGKNIGGTLGTPFEGKRGVFDIDFYTSDITKGSLPNDDLDLQLVWLMAAEKYGPAVNAEILAEYWAYKIVPHWSEYGQGKINVRGGLVPPVSGKYFNYMKDSCGCFIRSEIWACLCPGHPEIAVKYAYEDACVDHADEGLYGEIFTAALESAAFVEDDLDKLVEIAASYIPADSKVAGAVRLVQKCKAEGKTWREARRILLTEFPDAFVGTNRILPCEEEDKVPCGTVGMDAPSNIGIAMIGWYYGEGDFGKSLCTAVNCGEDADCTAATLGSIWGILKGTKGIPEKWLAPIGDEIKTICLDMTHGGTFVCKTVSELTKRVANLMPAFLNGYVNLCGESGIEITAETGDDLFDKEQNLGVYLLTSWKKELALRDGYTVKVESPFYDAFLKYPDGIEIREGEEATIKLIFLAKFRQGWIEAKLNMPADWEVRPCPNPAIPIGVGDGNLTEYEIRFVPHNLTQGRCDFCIETRLSEMRMPKAIPVTLIVK